MGKTPSNLESYTELRSKFCVILKRIFASLSLLIPTGNLINGLKPSRDRVGLRLNVDQKFRMQALTADVGCQI